MTKPSVVKDLLLKANHNSATIRMAMGFVVKDLLLKANHNSSDSRLIVCVSCQRSSVESKSQPPTSRIHSDEVVKDLLLKANHNRSVGKVFDVQLSKIFC